MKSRLQKVGFALLTLALAAGLAVSALAASKTYTGTVSDAMCGAHHMGDAAACTRGCVSKGSKYALVVGDKVYTLETSDQEALATLDQQAGAKAAVTGTEKCGTITVSAVKASQ
jgi:cytochrome c-type biogenesis protein CcmE